MPKITKKRLKFKIVPFLILLVILVILYFFITFLINTKTKNIFIHNNNILSDQEIIELAKLEEYPSFYKTFSKTIKKRLLTHPLIKNVEIKRGFFNIFNIYIKEYKVVLLTKDQLYYILDDGTKIDNKYNIDVPILANEVNGDVYDRFITSLKKINENSYKDISEFKYDPSKYDETRFLLYMNDGNHVYINTPKMEKINYYNEIYPTLNNKKGTIFLDSGNHFEAF